MFSGWWDLSVFWGKNRRPWMSFTSCISVSWRGHWAVERGKSLVCADSWTNLKRSSQLSVETERSHWERTGGYRTIWPPWPEKTRCIHPRQQSSFLSLFSFLQTFQMVKVNPLLLTWPSMTSEPHINTCSRSCALSPGSAWRDAGSSEWEGWTEAQGSLVYIRSGTDRKHDGCQGEKWRGKNTKNK